MKIGPGIFPVAVLGSKKMNVESIDSASVTLEGGHSGNYFSISPVAMRKIDVISPSYDTGGSVCHQTDEGPDGFLDAIFYFRKSDVLNIPDVAAADTGEVVVLRVKGIYYQGQYTYQSCRRERWNKWFWWQWLSPSE